MKHIDEVEKFRIEKEKEIVDYEQEKQKVELNDYSILEENKEYYLNNVESNNFLNTFIEKKSDKTDNKSSNGCLNYENKKKFFKNFDFPTLKSRNKKIDNGKDHFNSIGDNKSLHYEDIKNNINEDDDNINNYLSIYKDKEIKNLSTNIFMKTNISNNSNSSINKKNSLIKRKNSSNNIDKNGTILSDNNKNKSINLSEIDFTFKKNKYEQNFEINKNIIYCI